MSAIICGENFVEYFNRKVGVICPNFMEKTFVGGYQTMKFVKVFSLESSHCTVEYMYLGS